MSVCRSDQLSVPASPDRTSSRNEAILIGATVGGVALFILLMISLVLLFKRRSGQNLRSSVENRLDFMSTLRIPQKGIAKSKPTGPQRSAPPQHSVKKVLTERSNYISQATKEPAYITRLSLSDEDLPARQLNQVKKEERIEERSLPAIAGKETDWLKVLDVQSSADAKTMVQFFQLLRERIPAESYEVVWGAFLNAGVMFVDLRDMERQDLAFLGIHDPDIQMAILDLLGIKRP